MIISVLLMASKLCQLLFHSQSGHCSSPYIIKKSEADSKKVTANAHKHKTTLLWQSHNNCNIHMHVMIPCSFYLSSGRTVHTN